MRPGIAGQRAAGPARASLIGLASLLVSWPVAAGAAATDPAGDVVTAPAPAWSEAAHGPAVDESTASAVVRVTGEGFDPAVVRIPAGGVVLWRSELPEPHTVTALDVAFDAHPDCLPPDPVGCLVAGDRVSIAFVEPGTYRYSSRGWAEGGSFTGEIVVDDAPAEEVPTTVPGDPPGTAVPCVATATSVAGEPISTTAPCDPTGTTVPDDPTGTTVPGDPTGTTVPCVATATSIAGEPTSTTAPCDPTGTTVPDDATDTPVHEDPTGTTAPGGPTGTTATTVPDDPTGTTAPGGTTGTTATTVPEDPTTTTVLDGPTTTTTTTTTGLGDGTGTTLPAQQAPGTTVADDLHVTTTTTTTTTDLSLAAPSSTAVGAASLIPAHPGPHPVAVAPVVSSPAPLPPWRQAPAPGPVAGGAVARPSRSSGFPAHLQAMTDSIPRSGSSSTARLMDAVTALERTGVTQDLAIRSVFGRFPVGGLATYSHDWWFPRFGPVWRLHQGTDIFAPYGTAVRAPADGVVSFANGGLGGLSVRVTEPDGTYWYLAHLSGLAEGLPAGTSVRVGDIVGYVGNSGNARGTPPHLHIELHPGGGPAVDPKATLDAFLLDAEEAVGFPADPAVLTTSEPTVAPAAELDATPVALPFPIVLTPAIPAAAGHPPHRRELLGPSNGSPILPSAGGRRLGALASDTAPTFHEDPVVLAAVMAVVGAGLWPGRTRFKIRPGGAEDGEGPTSGLKV